MRVIQFMFLAGCLLSIVACGKTLQSGSYNVAYKDIVRDCNVDLDNRQPYLQDATWQIESYVTSGKAAVTVYKKGSTEMVDHGFVYLGRVNGFEDNGSGFLDFPPKDMPGCLEGQSRVYMQLLHPVSPEFENKTIYSKGCLSMKNDQFAGTLFFRLDSCASSDPSCLEITCNIERKVVGRLIISNK